MDRLGLDQAMPFNRPVELRGVLSAAPNRLTIRTAIIILLSALLCSLILLHVQRPAICATFHTSKLRPSMIMLLRETPHDYLPIRSKPNV